MSEGYVPTLDPVNMDQVLDKHTGFYYYHAGEGEELPASSTEITSWKKVDDNTELAPTDLVKAYFAYTIPAGTLNETNQVARYRLPSNLHLTDDQIIAINQQENGIASQFINYDTLEITDSEKYDLYRGAEAVEGTRTPDQTLADDAQEYISAVVKAENVYDVEGLYGEKGAYLGQDLIFIFTPYTIEKNQNTYDSEGNPTSAGHKVTGWFACDFNMDQIDWVEAETDTDHDKTTVKKIADILFAAQDDSLNIKEISQTLKLVETIEAPEDAAEDAVGETADADDESAEAESTNPEETEDNAATSATKDTAEMTDDTAADIADTAETSEAEPTYKDGTLTASGADYTITLDYTADACIPENAELKIREITKESDPLAYDACLSQAKEQVIDPSADENKTVDEKTSRFFDIEIMVPGTPDDTGEMDAPRKIEPKAPVNVNIHLTETTKAATETSDQSVQDSQDQPAQTSDPTVLHFLEDRVETIESTTAPAVSTEQENSTESSSNTEEGKQIQFEASSFSVYGVVYTSVITTTYITASGETYEITVSYDAEAGIPEGATLAVSEIEPGTAEYDDYLNSSATELGVEDAEGISFARFFDIEIHDKDGEKVEPKTPVTVQISYVNGIEMEQDEHLSVVHFADQGIEIIDNVDVNENADTITYAQESFSVTGTVVNGGPRNGQMYMLVVEYEGQKYLINNDGTLVPAADVETGKISVEYPMLWTYYYQYGAHFRFASEASGFNADQTASGFYYRYIDPNVANGLSEENKSGNGTNLTNETQIYYNGTNISSVRNSNMYIGVSNEGGTLHIAGQQNSRNAAEISLYSAEQVHPSGPANHTVNHIDISISGSAQVDVPLAYGVYYYKDDSGNWKKIIVGKNVENPDDGIPLGHEKYENHTESLAAQNIGITSDDMKHAIIKAYKTKTVNGQQVADLDNEVNDAFYITGYSANETTLWSTDQVRIEGAFKVSTMDPVNPDYWWDINSERTRHERKSKAITYVVEATKKLQMDLTYTDDQGHKYQLYQSTTDNEPMTITAEVPLGASFNYWTDIHGVGNECPPLQEAWGYRSEWRDGGIQPWGISGMDFVLTSHVTGVPAKIVALEITKKVVDENGNVINNIKEPIESTFEVYQDKPGDPTSVREVGSETHDYGTYTKLHDQKITIATNGTGHKYDYNVSGGMYYIRESRTGLPIQIQTTDGKTYTYIKTVINTEYSYRANQYRQRDSETGSTTSQQMHETTIVSSNANLNSIPEVLGDYKDDNGDNETNEFLEFYFYNVYSETETPPPPEPVYKTLDIELDKKWQDGNDTTAPVDGTITFKLHQIVTQNGNSQTDVSSGYPKTFTVRAADGWKLTIPDLPWYETDTHDNYVKYYKYYLEEDVSKATGSATNYKAPSFTNGYGSINSPIEGEEDNDVVTVEVTNKTGNVLRIQKRWLNVDPDVAPDVTIKVWRKELGLPNSGNVLPELYQTITLTNQDRVKGENWWMKEIQLPPDRPTYLEEKTVWHPEIPPYGENVVEKILHTGDYAYYISENGLDTNDYLKPRFYKLSGDETIDDYQAWAITGPGDQQGMGFDYEQWGNHERHPETTIMASDGKDGTLIVMNAPNNTFHHVYFSKEWYKYNQNGQLVKADNADTKNYAIGIQIYQRLKSNDNSNEWHAFAKPIYIGAPNGIIDCNGKNYIMDENNPFVFNDAPTVEDGTWKWLFRDEGAQNGFPRYAIVDGNTVYYEYEAREIGVYTTENNQKVSSAEQLQRVFDYSNIQTWNFDENAASNQNNGPKGINVEAGKLKVTKRWSNGHVGSRIYFQVFQNDTDITETIVGDPDSYDLTEQQVYDDGTHKALIVKSDGTNWENLLIQGLPKAPAGGGSPYQYSIKEIGYSEADGTNCWDGETIVDSNGSIRKDPHGNNIIVHISELLTGYQIDGATESQTNGRSASTTILESGEPHIIQVNNSYVEKYKDLEITKIWQDSTANFLTWPSEKTSITVDLYANGTKVVGDIPLYINPPSQTSKKEFTWNGVTYNWDISFDQSGTIYTFTIYDLPAKVDEGGSQVDAVYEIREHKDTDFVISYGYFEEVEENVQQVDSEGHPVYDNNGQPVYKTDPATGELIKVTKKVFLANNNATGVQDGKVIRNLVTEEDGFELPSTGGSGTRWIYILGTALTFFAVGLLWKRKPQ